MPMRDEVIKELKKRMLALELADNQRDLANGMAGIDIAMFPPDGNDARRMRRHWYSRLEILDLITPEEWNENVYDDWLEEQHNRIYMEICARFSVATSHSIE